MPSRRKNFVVQGIQNLIGSFFSSFAGIGGLFSKNSRLKRRRNADFDKAGNETNLPPVADKESTANIKRAVRERDLEVLNAIRQEKKMLRRNDNEAKEYRKAKEQDNLEVSRGEVMSHLAAMQRKAAEKKKADRESSTDNAEINGSDQSASEQTASKATAEKQPEENNSQ